MSKSQMERNPIDLTNFHVMALEMSELRIAIAEALEDGVRTMIPLLLKFRWALEPRHWPRRSIKKWHK